MERTWYLKVQINFYISLNLKFSFIDLGTVPKTTETSTAWRMWPHTGRRAPGPHFLSYRMGMLPDIGTCHSGLSIRSKETVCDMFTVHNQNVKSLKGMACRRPRSMMLIIN